MANPRADVSTNWTQMLTRLNVIGVRRLAERITMASDLFSFMTSPFYRAMFSLPVCRPPCTREFVYGLLVGKTTCKLSSSLVFDHVTRVCVW